jgi:hypothetical protein
MNLASLHSLRRAVFLDSWFDGVAPEHVAIVRGILETMVDRLISDGAAPLRAPVLVSDAVVALNEADTGFICSLEREDLCDYFFAVGTAAGLPEDDVQAAIDLRTW